ncbi:hypothetical protein BJ170DRAFT_651560 [Xylariales sp. AK1849]|nr:hypothetical protein BJ170DRAFT_651560 [Xylariales sp. AK1849]
MAVDVEELIVQPFRELVQRGREAVANAEAECIEPQLAWLMLRAARAIVREGERALYRVQPLLDANLEKHGDAFREAMRENDDLFASQRQLEDVLYDLDDFIELDNFDARKFAEVQAASKSFALCAIEIMKRLRIEDGLPESPTSSRSLFPPLPPLPTGRVEPLMISRPSTRGENYGIGPMLVNSRHSKSLPQMGRASSGSIRSSMGGAPPRRMSNRKSQKSLAPSTSSSDSQYSQQSSKLSNLWPVTPDTISKEIGSPRPSTPEILSEEIENMQIMSEPNIPQRAGNRPARVSVSAIPWTTAWVNEQLASTQHGPQPRTVLEDARARHVSADNPGSVHKKHRYTFSSSTGSSARSMPDPISPTSTGNRTSVFSSSYGHMSYLRKIAAFPTGEYRRSSLVPSPYESLSSSNLDIPSPLHESPESPFSPDSAIGLDLKEDATSPPAIPAKASARTTASPSIRPIWHSCEENCTIGPNSTLRHLKGFCDGAHAFKTGRVQEATKTALVIETPAVTANHDTMSGAALALGATEHVMAMNARTVVSQCRNCEYRHLNTELSRDLKNDPKANQSKEGVRYRLRFLYKSHVATDSVVAVRYGCLFCEHSGFTTREGDATVFTSEMQLLRHLAYHSQPLPQIPGVTVLYGNLGEYHPNAEDYDLHFPDPPLDNPTSDLEAALFARLPVAQAVKSHVQRHGEKAPTDPDGRKDVLQFLVGARIVGVQYPDQWGGKWCTGWHDGVRGAFPAKMIVLSPPSKSGVRLPGTNNDGVVVTARWKWETKDPSAGWIVFDKNATINNVSWLSYDSWCWSGMTKDGRIGFFPASHIKGESIRDAPATPATGFKARRLFKRRAHSSVSSISD